MRPFRYALPLTELDVNVFFNELWYGQLRTIDTFKDPCLWVEGLHFKDKDKLAISITCVHDDFTSHKAPTVFAHKRKHHSDIASFDLELFGFQRDQYNIVFARDIDDPERGVAVVTGKRWRSMWVLSRAKEPSEEVMADALSFARAHVRGTLEPNTKSLKRGHKGPYLVK